MFHFIQKLAVVSLLLSGLSGIASAGLPDPGVQLTRGNTAIVITDPQNDFLHPKGVAWGLVGKNVLENNTIENIERLFKIAKQKNHPCFHLATLLFPA